jgi:hypothetical protein
MKLTKGDHMDSNAFLLSFGMKPEDLERFRRRFHLVRWNKMS